MDSKVVEELLVRIKTAHPNASDLNFTVGRPIQVEIDSELRPVELDSLQGNLNAKTTAGLAEALIGPNALARDDLEKRGSCDCAYGLPDGSRFRVNIFQAGGSTSLVLRALPTEIPTLKSLELPQTIGAVPELLNGLVLVTGSTGSGKSTTLASIVGAINASRSVHVVTLEDPIEFRHPHVKGTINQRELGSDFTSYADGLRAALRQAPKVILVGEMRDRETVEIALKAAETGHLVLSTLHTIDAGQTINRIVGLFELGEQHLIRSRLSQTLRYVIGQRLIPREDAGRIAIQEIMGMNLRVKELILEGESEEKTFYDVISAGKAYGMQSFDQHILDHYREGKITREMAMTYSTDSAVVARWIDDVMAERGEETSDLGKLEMATSRRQGL